MTVDASSAFLRSVLTEEKPFISTQDTFQWIEERKANTHVLVELTTFDQLEKWEFSDRKTTLRHETGRFFSIDGIRVKTTHGAITEWDQPIINQPEVGYLGILTKEIAGVLYLLMQAKIEPGNIANVQLAPTLQATRSNYTRAHEGQQQKFIHYFTDRVNNKVLVDQLQSEQGARFLRKRNRNIIIQTFQDVPHDEDYQWLTLGQIKRLLAHDNIVNMDARTVISGIPYGQYHDHVGSFFDLLKCYGVSSEEHGTAMLESVLDMRRSLHTFDDVLGWLTNEKQKHDLSVERIPLAAVRDWQILPERIEHVDHRYFQVVPVKVEIEGREVQHWCQPMVRPMQEGLIAFVVKKINGIYHFLIQTKLEVGNFDVLECAPTIQCVTGDYKSGSVPFLELVLDVPKDRVLYDQRLSEEGGRFYREQNRNLIVEIEEDMELDLPSNYAWLSLNQLATLIRFNNYLNIQARSLLSVINFS